MGNCFEKCLGEREEDREALVSSSESCSTLSDGEYDAGMAENTFPKEPEINLNFLQTLIDNDRQNTLNQRKLK